MFLIWLVGPHLTKPVVGLSVVQETVKEEEVILVIFTPFGVKSGLALKRKSWRC